MTLQPVAAEFVDVLLADDEFVRAEFDALMAAGWGTPPREELPPETPAEPPRAGCPAEPGYRRQSGPAVARRWGGRLPRSPPAAH
jgi:hypothetical protein